MPCSSSHTVPFSRYSCLSHVQYFCFSLHRSFSSSFPNKPSPCLTYLVYFFLFFLFFLHKVWLDKISAFSEICQWDFRSARPWRSLNTNYLCTKRTLSWVPREPALFPSLWQGLPSVHTQLSLLWQGPSSATETGQGPTGKWRSFWLWYTGTGKVYVSQINVSSISLDLGNCIIFHKDWADGQRDESAFSTVLPIWGALILGHGIAGVLYWRVLGGGDVSPCLTIPMQMKAVCLRSYREPVAISTSPRSQPMP